MKNGSFILGGLTVGAVIFAYQYGRKSAFEEAIAEVKKKDLRPPHWYKPEYQSSPKYRWGADIEPYFRTRGEAQAVLNQLRELVVEYGQVEVADFYDLIGVRSEAKDHICGWRDLTDAKVLIKSSGYFISFPLITELH